MMTQMMTIAVMAAGLMAGGCASQKSAADPSMGHNSHAAMMEMDTHAHNANDQAVAVIHPTKGNKVYGIVRFAPTEGGVRVTADLHGLPPNSTHGFHIHEYGDCSAPDASSAGGHYNPEHHEHAGPKVEMRHAGDLGNIKADANGDAHLDLTVDNITVDGSKNPILGRAVIVHQKADDLKSQPTGDAGARIACGVIGLAKS
jgi:Cu-Zn family superoxide dismutase